MREEAERSEGGTWLQTYRDLKREKNCRRSRSITRKKNVVAYVISFFYFKLLSLFVVFPFFSRMNISTVAFCCIVFFFFFPSYCDLFDFYFSSGCSHHSTWASPKETTTNKRKTVLSRLVAPLHPPLPLPHSAPASSVVQQARNLEIALKSCHEPDRLFNSWFLSVLCHSLCPSFCLCILPGKKIISDALKRIYILLLQSENTSSHKGSAWNCVQIAKQKKGEFFLWDTKMRQLCSASVQKLYGCNSYCVEAICNSLCEFVFED